jgi:Ca2+-binding EF-hand superfamily protein
VFADQDRNFDGLVDQTQLVAMVKHLLDSTSAELLFDLDWNPDDSYDAAFLFNSLDTDGDGKVSFQEVVAWWRANILDAEKKTKTNKEFDPNETFHESLLVGTRGPFAALAGRKAELAKEAPAAGRTSGAYFTTSVLENSTKVISGIVGASFAIESVAHLAGRTSEMTTVRSDDAVAETGTNATAVSLDPVNNSLDPVVDVSLDDAAADDAPNDARTIATQSAFSAGD